MLSLRPIAPLPKITAPTASAVAAKFKPQPPALALLKPQQTPPEYLAALEQHKMAPDAVNLLAHGMPERDSVWWACQSSQKVAGKLNPADANALSAAQTWVKNPTPQTQALAAAAAAKTDYTGPGGWAAQAAAWSKPPSPAAAVPAVGFPAIPTAPAAPAAPAAGLTAPAVAGSVMLAAGLVNRPAMPPVNKPSFSIPTAPRPVLPSMAMPTVKAPEIPPVDLDKQSSMLQPFIDLGKDVASGKNTWA
jgi:hypothetical protein